MKSNTTRRGFTLIELLTVIAIIGILAAIIIPTTASVRKAAKKSKTRIVFTNWVGAMEAFKQEYGYYPKLDIATPTSTTRTYLIRPATFAAALTGRDLSGDRISDVDDRFGNKKERTFYSFATTDLNTARDKIIDPFGNSEIAVLFDRNGDGLIKIGSGNDDDGLLPDVRPGENPSGTGGLAPTNVDANSDIPDTGRRASVIFYSAGNGKSDSDLVMSWK